LHRLVGRCTILCGHHGRRPKPEAGATMRFVGCSSQ
jgi:hypothetical protein